MLFQRAFSGGPSVTPIPYSKMLCSLGPLVAEFPRTIEEEVALYVKRNTVVLFTTLFLLAIFAWAGWANWESRKQEVAKRLAVAARGELVANSAGDNTPVPASPLLNKPAPDFTLEAVNGKRVSLASFKGKAVLLNFWATWCGPCKIETPWIVELRNQYASQGFEVVGVDTEDDDVTPTDKAGWERDRAGVASFVKQMHMDYPVLLGGDSLAQAYGGLDAMPTSFYLDRDGKVVTAQMGITSKDDMEANILKALGK